MQPGDMSIGELAKRSGVKVTTIRFYEQIGLMPEPPRSEGDRRRYDADHQRRLTFIRHARELGFEMADVRALLDLADRPGRSCEDADRIARKHLDEVNSKIARLSGLQGELVRMIESCGRGTVADCRVIDTLSDHAHCAAEHR